MTRPKLLDLFCSAGGAGMGYHRAGWDVTGVDIEPQPHYPFPFVQADAMELLADPAYLDRFAAVHASPPCQHFAGSTKWRGSADDHPDLLTPTLAILRPRPQLYVVENVPDAGQHMRTDWLLCGSMFGLAVRRHRRFETNWPGTRMLPPCNHHAGLLPFMHKGERAYADALGCEWMSSVEGREAIPPAYTRFLGEQLLSHVLAGAA